MELEKWARTCVDIVGFVENSEIKELSRLFSLAGDEKNIGTAKDQLLGERVCNRQFTVINLLRHMKLNKLAVYYKKRGLYKHKVLLLLQIQKSVRLMAALSDYWPSIEEPTRRNRVYIGWHRTAKSITLARGLEVEIIKMIGNDISELYLT